MRRSIVVVIAAVVVVGVGAFAALRYGPRLRHTAEQPPPAADNTVTPTPPAVGDAVAHLPPAPPLVRPEIAPGMIPPHTDPQHPVTQPDYPPISKRLGETGTVIMLLTVDQNGKVTDAKIDKSSGFYRLDQAATQEALQSWHLLPGTVNGKPTAMQYKFAVTFRITDDDQAPAQGDQQPPQ